MTAVVVGDIRVQRRDSLQLVLGLLGSRISGAAGRQEENHVFPASLLRELQLWGSSDPSETHFCR